MTEIEDESDFRAALRELLTSAAAADVPPEVTTGLLTAHLAAIRGDVRLPLSMPPARAQTFLERVRDHEGETMQVDVQVTESVIDELALQLRVLTEASGAGEGPGSDGSATVDGADDGE
jgi:uncharacterized protein (DUF2267 family)